MRFQLLYEGFVLGGAQLAGRPEADFAKTRLEARIARKLCAVSEESHTDDKPLPTGRKRRGLPDGGAPVDLVLEQAELDAIVKRIEAVKWAPDWAEDVVDAVDHLMAAARAEES